MVGVSQAQKEGTRTNRKNRRLHKGVMSITAVPPAPSSSEDCTARKLGDLRLSDFVKTCLIIADFASALVQHDLSLRERDSLHEFRIDPLASRIGTRQSKRMEQNLYAAGIN